MDRATSWTMGSVTSLITGRAMSRINYCTVAQLDLGPADGLRLS